MNYLELLKLASPETIVVVTALGVLAIGLASTRASAFCSLVAGLGLVVAIGAVLVLPRNATLFSGMLVISPLTSLFKVICIGLAFFAVLLARSDRSSRNHGEYLAILLLATIGLMLLVGSEELLMIFIGLELLGLSLYVMVAFDKTDRRSAEAGLKYFLFGSTASAFTLFGISFIYGMSGTTGLAAVGQKLSAGPVQPLLAVGIVMTLIGFAFKIAAAPFHLWAPDAYQGAPVPSAAFIASGSKVASFVVLGKIVLVGFAPVHGSADWHAMVAGWSPVLAALAALSILVGNLVALAQTNVRRLLATLPSRTPATHCSGSSPAGAMDFLQRCFTPRSMRSRSSAHSASSRWCGAKQAATISPILPVCGHVRRCLPRACRSSCCRWRACRRWLDFSGNSTSSAPRCAPMQITACSGLSRWRFLAASSRFIIT